MAKTKISPTPFRQIYFGQKPSLIEKNLEKLLEDPIKLKAQLKGYYEENERIVKENNSLKSKLIDKDLEIKDLNKGFDAKEANWTNEKTNLENQVKLANATKDKYLEDLKNSRKFNKEIYHYLGNYGSNPILQNLGQLKWLLRKHDKPKVDSDYYTLYDLAKCSPTEFKKLEEKFNQTKKDLALRNEQLQELRGKLLHQENYNDRLDQDIKKAWTLITHLRIDLQLEKDEVIIHKQDKAHIQKELDDALAILNKPKTEMGTQTDLTAEQISQIEKDISKYQTDIQIEQNKVSLLQNELVNLGKEIKDLREQAQTNPTEKQFLVYVNWKNWKPSDYLIIKQELETGKTAFSQWDWNNLRPNYKEIRNKLLELVQSLIEGKTTQEQLEQKNKELEEKLKEQELNEAEKELLDYVERGIETPYAGTIPPNELLEKLQKEDKWTSLRPEYEIVRQKLIKLTKRELERRDLQTKITKLTKNKEELQTKLDLETKTKEELLEYLNIYRKNDMLSFNHISHSSPNSVSIDEINAILKDTTSPISFVYLWSNENNKNKVFDVSELKGDEWNLGINFINIFTPQLKDETNTFLIKVSKYKKYRTFRQKWDYYLFKGMEVSKTNTETFIFGVDEENTQISWHDESKNILKVVAKS